MIIPVFKIQIVSAETGVVASSYGGGALEKELAAAVIEALRARHVGIFAGRTQVEAAVTEAIQVACLALKHRTNEVLAERFAPPAPPAVSPLPQESAS